MVHRLPRALVDLATTQCGVLLGSQISPVTGDRRLAAYTHDGALIRLWRNAYVIAGGPVDATSDLRPLDRRWVGQLPPASTPRRNFTGST